MPAILQLPQYTPEPLCAVLRGPFCRIRDVEVEEAASEKPDAWQGKKNKQCNGAD